MDDPKPFHLVRYFTAVTAPLIILCIVVAALTHRATMLDGLKKMGELANVTLGQTFSNTYTDQLQSVQAFSASEAIRKNWPDWMIHDLLNRPVREFLQNTPVLQVKIFSLTGQTIFAGNDASAEKSAALSPDIISAIKSGKIVSKMDKYPLSSASDGMGKSVMIIDTFMPMYEKQKIVGIIELYNNVNSAYEEMQNGLQLFVAVLFLLGLLLFYTVIYFVQKTERAIETKHETEKRDHEYLKVAFKKATESTRVKSEFLANMSHELRTPLNAIIGYSEIMMEENRDNGNASAQEDLQHIKSAGLHLKTLIEEILDHAKIESGVIDIQTRNCRLADMIDACISYVAPAAKSNGNSIHIDIDETISEINTDATKLKRIIINLLSNANKFTHRGKITITVENKQGYLCLSVADTGKGIPKEQFQAIFQPFTQVDNSSTRQHGGTGLGLTISKEYAKVMGGDISVESEVGKGTIMVLHIPYCPTHEEQLATIDAIDEVSAKTENNHLA